MFNLSCFNQWFYVWITLVVSIGSLDARLCAVSQHCVAVTQRIVELPRGAGAEICFRSMDGPFQAGG